MKTCLLLILLFYVAGAIEIRRDVHCMPGWTYFGGACYIFMSQTKEPWALAASHCSQLQGKLTDITNGNENAFLKSELMKLHEHDSNKSSTCYFTAGSDIIIEDLWTWASTGNALNFTDWAPSEPNNGRDRNQDCLSLWGKYNYEWDDYWCDRKCNFICKRR